MKIGILTYHRAENYGALLQAYALRTFLQQQGHEVSFVDYWPKYHVEHYRIFSPVKFKKLGVKGKINYLFVSLLWFIPKYKRKHRLEKFMCNRLQLDGSIKYLNDKDVTEPYDLVVYGSDQIWRRQSIHNKDYNPWYFGAANVVSKKKITYAASMGIIDTNEQDDEHIKEWLKNFDALSVRELDLKKYVEKLGYRAQLVCDPTFLLSKKEWSKLYQSVENGKYILFYNLLNSSESLKFANALSRLTGLPVKEINMEFNLKHIFSKRYFTCASVEQFLQLIEGAEYVVSNSFHGVAMSLIFEKQFWAVGFGAKASRVVSLLNSVGLSERFCRGEEVPLTLPCIKYDEPMKKRLNDMVFNSMLYLKDYMTL